MRAIQKQPVKVGFERACSNTWVAVGEEVGLAGDNLKIDGYQRQNASII